MAHPRVLVLENQRFQRSVLIKMLDRLGLQEVRQASSTKQAMAQLHACGGVDIVLCDLADRSLDCLEFLRGASQAGLVQAVALCSELRPELRRALAQMRSLSGLQMLGVLSQPLQLRALRHLLHSYWRRRLPSARAPAPAALPHEHEIHQGLALGEFRAWYQPKFMLGTGRLAGVEALVRWEHPTRGVLLPAQFLAAVLAYDLIDPIFKQLLEQGLNLLGMLRRQHIQLELAFNLHASQLLDDELLLHIQQALLRHGLPGTTLLFELAENGLLDLSPRIQENLLRLRLLGCGLSIDDFGTGFSSLKLLCQLPFNQLKLDGAFVRHVDDPQNQAMVASTLALARSLGMSLVIEGIGTQRSHEGVLALGCEIGQGFYLARPMAGYRLIPWLEAHFAGQKNSHELS
ncbi:MULTISPECIES: EAL domain-containing response regulator [Pseudomonas]|uniref:EAL domain-containing response regulator n=1 Tax=Pseudomonas TaxID=286 RepID=UPI001F2F110C|nr:MULTISPECIES: EAL domain-containing response regulator [Pseudomonas]